MRPEEQAMIQRLRSAEGHLHAVTCMIEDNQPCEQVLHQLGAVQASLRAAGLTLLRDQLESSAEVIRNDPHPEERAAELKRIVNLYRLLCRKPSLNQKTISEVK